MKRYWASTHRPGSLIVSAIVFVLLAITLTAVFNYRHSEKTVASKLIKTIDLRYGQSQKLITGFVSKYSEPSRDNLNELLSGLQESCNLYLFKNDSVIFWTSSNLSPDSLLQSVYKKQRIIKSGNGYYQLFYYISGNYKYIVSDLIKSDYIYNNDYLKPSFSKPYGFAENFLINLSGQDTRIVSKNGNYLFSIKQNGSFLNHGYAFFPIFLLYLAALLLLITESFLLIQKTDIVRKYPVLILMLPIVVFFFRSITGYLKIPAALYSSDFFSPLFFAYSSYLPSIGDLFTDSLVITLLSFLLFRFFRNQRFPERMNHTLKLLLGSLLILINIILFLLSVYLINILINNSSFNMDLSDIQDINMYTFVAYAIIFNILLALFFLTFTLTLPGSRIFGNRYVSVLSILISLAVFGLLYFGNYFLPAFPVLVLWLVFISLLFMFHSRKLGFSSFASVVLALLVLTVMSSVTLLSAKKQKEKDERKLLALRMSSDRDKMGEFLFIDIENQIKNDTTLNRLFSNAWANPEMETECTDFIKQKYFKRYWVKYDIQITLCFPDKSLQIKPQNYIIACSEYFGDIIGRLGEKTAASNLYYLHESYDANSYIARIPVVIKESMQSASSVIIELTPKYVPKGLGYPELLMDKTSSSLADISDYSYALFYNGELVKNVGEFNYGVSEVSKAQSSENLTFFDLNDYNHLIYKADAHKTIIISRRHEGITALLTPFTYQLVFHVLILLLGYLIYSLRFAGKNRSLDFKTRLQLMVISFVLLSSVALGAVSISNIKNLSAKKNKDMLSEKAHSVLIEMEHKLASFDTLDESQKVYLEELLTKFSLVFFSDINIYTVDGRLLASSRPQVFEEGLKSEMMDEIPYRELSQNKRTLYIDNDLIGTYHYLSAYIPFRNDDNKLTAFINLPYFAREQELRKEIATFLLAFFNTYVIITVLAVFISLLAGNYLMRPLQLIRNRFSRLNISTTNEKIEYSRKDELGDLINEYNLMVDKLAESAEMLARSERESAWREMAKQVAHEIKNPLTPMKLSIQHLWKSWNDHTPEWENRLEKTTRTLIEQIDSLASIASAFSDFAKLPAPDNTKTDLTVILRNILALFVDHPDVKIQYTLPEHECMVIADEKQLSRAFINLMNNALQAIPANQQGLIIVKLSTNSGIHTIEISDNGTGIDEEKKSKIFSPNFTTKSGGMGLGLAMVRNIVDSAGGKISFSSEKGSGTIFVIELPEVNV